MFFSYPLGKFLKYDFLHAPPYGLSNISSKVSTPLFIRWKINELVITTEYFYKFLRIDIIKTWRATDKPIFNGLKKPFWTSSLEHA